MDDQGVTTSAEGEQIEGAPPVHSAEERSALRAAEQMGLNRFLYTQSQEILSLLLHTPDVQSLLEVLLVNLPRHFELIGVELWLYDPEGVLRELLGPSHRYGSDLQFFSDGFDMQELHDLEPQLKKLDASDPEMMQILTAHGGVSQALLMPLVDGARLIGSLHWGLGDDVVLQSGQDDMRLLSDLNATIAACFRNVVRGQMVSRLTMLDPLTQISNLRGFEKDIAREISRARRATEPFAVQLISIDDFESLVGDHGEQSANFALKKVTERISSSLRPTDLLARLDEAIIAVLVSNSGEALAQDIAERTRRDIEQFQIDDGRGAVLQVSLSIGFVSWDPQQYPAVDMPQLARQMEALANTALERAQHSGGNRCVTARLNPLIV